jgi:hypothetical protein
MQLKLENPAPRGFLFDHGESANFLARQLAAFIPNSLARLRSTNLFPGIGSTAHAFRSYIFF